ncbi:hypothetical protein JRO89_XS14G0096100 [Xanthoceras sorbifolium]|uniref:Uncharacterized protein n=1 Tax=Xanthoceras sorbifolium TaxID=99658 RepID=A0ABQ8H4R7_9ROSI|nr:hypothetical protein JRO89_XS14G0096100 [Xanthoceras sorbifolium]
MPVVVPAPTVVPCEEPMTFGDVVTDPVAEAVLVIPRLTLEDGEEQQVVVGKSSDSSPMPIVEVPITWEQPPHVLHGVPSCNVVCASLDCLLPKDPCMAPNDMLTGAGISDSNTKVFSFSAGSSSGIRGWHWKHRARECYDEDVRMHCEKAGGKRVILISDDTESNCIYFTDDNGETYRHYGDGGGKDIVLVSSKRDLRHSRHQVKLLLHLEKTTPVKGLLFAFFDSETKTPVPFLARENRRVEFDEAKAGEFKWKLEETEENRGVRASLSGLKTEKAGAASSDRVLFLFSTLSSTGVTCVTTRLRKERH